MKLHTLGLILRDTMQAQLDRLAEQGIIGPMKLRDTEIRWNGRDDVFILNATLGGPVLPASTGSGYEFPCRRRGTSPTPTWDGW